MASTTPSRRRERTAGTGDAKQAPLANDALRAPRLQLLRTTLALALSGSVLLWVAFPPLDWGWLAWLAPLPWLRLIRQERLYGSRPYLAITAAGLVFWMGVLHWLRLPHWATSFGWVALSGYLALYLPLFVGLSRIAVHRFGWPLIVAAPVVWTGLEWFRTWFLTGFGMAALGYTQHRWLAIIQVSDLAGTYAVSFVVMFAAACAARMLPCAGRPFDWRPLVPMSGLLAAVLGYGHARLTDGPTPPAGGARKLAALKLALVQGCIDTEFKYEPGRPLRIYKQYLQLSRDALRTHPGLDLLVWPETMFGYSCLTADRSLLSPATANARWRRMLADEVAQSEMFLAQTARTFSTGQAKPALLLGVDIAHCAGENQMQHFNSALFLDSSGRLRGRYDKMHPVIFGEYIPLGDRLPWLYRLTPMAGGIEAGGAPQTFDVAGLRLCPNICFETCVPQLVRRQVDGLRRDGKEPDVLVNLTNDGWFWGSSELDMHLVCGVFRAVECRKPLVIAANTGFSASIDGSGRVLARGPRHDTGYVVAEVSRDARTSPYVRYGDWPAGLCLLLTGLLGGTALIRSGRHDSALAAGNG